MSGRLDASERPNFPPAAAGGERAGEGRRRRKHDGTFTVSGLKD